MTDLKNGTIIQGLPDIVGNQIYTQALSFAVTNMFRRILDYASQARTYSAVDSISDRNLLDALAFELRASPYNIDYPIETKRQLVKFALQYWSKAGTKAATEEVVRRIFGEAFISEWFEYGGDPGYFRIGITDGTIPDSRVMDFKEAAENVKRLSAWLDKVQLIITLDPWKKYTGFAVQEGGTDTLKMRRNGTYFYGFAVQDGTTETLKMSRT